MKLLNNDSVIRVIGVVSKKFSKHKEINDIEIKINFLEVLSYSNVFPFILDNKIDSNEFLKMKYRYLDLRNKKKKHNLIFRYNLIKKIRNYLDLYKFLEIETPVLVKPSLEGAREFVVPSRIYSGKFYSLQQSPQIFKQLLMMSSFDRYYQIVKCFRDEDLRSDRQPEFTQLDCELSFVTRKNILIIFEMMIRELFYFFKGFELKKFNTISYKDAICNYGTDKPDLRFEMKFVELNFLFKNSNFKIFDKSEMILGFFIKKHHNYNIKKIFELEKFIKDSQFKIDGFFYIKYELDGSFKSSFSDFFNLNDLNNFFSVLGLEKGDTLIITSGNKDPLYSLMSDLRLKLGNDLNLISKEKFSPLWVLDFPLFKFDNIEKKYTSVHHPFTSPLNNINLLDSEPLNIISNSYDLVVNGIELGGGSIRIDNANLQRDVFKILGFNDKEIDNKFGFFLNAFKYGVPPHGGIAFGIDRFCALINQSKYIRDFIAFPKNNSAFDLMTNSPS